MSRNINDYQRQNFFLQDEYSNSPQHSCQVDNSFQQEESYQFFSQQPLLTCNSFQQYDQLISSKESDDETISKPTPQDKSKKSQTFVLKIETAYPGESKNLPKCYGRQLQLFIKQVFENTEDFNLKQLKDDPDIVNFLAIPADKLRKFELNKFVISPKGKIFSKTFFGQCIWKFGVVKESKTSVDVLFRHNIEQFWEIIKKKKIEQKEFYN